MVSALIRFFGNPRQTLDRVIENPNRAEQNQVTVAAYVLAAVSAVLLTLGKLYWFPGVVGMIYRELMGRSLLHDGIVTVIIYTAGTFVILTFFPAIVKFVHDQLGHPFSPESQAAFRNALPWIIAATNAIGLVTWLPVVGLILALASFFLQYTWWKYLQDRLSGADASTSLSVIAVLLFVAVYGVIQLGVSSML